MDSVVVEIVVDPHSDLGGAVEVLVVHEVVAVWDEESETFPLEVVDEEGEGEEVDNPIEDDPDPGAAESFRPR